MQAARVGSLATSWTVASRCERSRTAQRHRGVATNPDWHIRRDRMRVDDKVREALVGTVILGFAATDCGA